MEFFKRHLSWFFMDSSDGEEEEEKKAFESVSPISESNHISLEKWDSSSHHSSTNSSRSSYNGSCGPGLFEPKPFPWWGRLARYFLKFGKIPHHVAIIMDGNRRFARSLRLPSVIDGHVRGFEQLAKVLHWCREFGIIEVSVYAFSIENFNRSSDEVQGLLEIAELKFLSLLEDEFVLIERNICVRFFGNRLLLPQRLQELMVKIESITREHNGAFLNICLAYTSRDEITRAMDAIRLDFRAGLIKKDDIDERLLNQYMDTRLSLPLDMLIRTSEKRLSDFMLWQTERDGCYVRFEKSVLWPQFEFYHLIHALLGYQLNALYSVSVDEIAAKQQRHPFIMKNEEKSFISKILNAVRSMFRKNDDDDEVFYPPIETKNTR